MKLLNLLFVVLINCGPVGPSIEVGRTAIEKAIVYIWTSKPEWHAGHCDMQNRYWCNDGKNQCCGNWS